jgi:hypothetical protein
MDRHTVVALPHIVGAMISEGMPCFLRTSAARDLRLRLEFQLPPSILTVPHLCFCVYNARVTNENHDIVSEIFRLIEEQTRSLQSRLSPEVAIRCQERSDRIRELLDQIRESGVSKQPAPSALAQTAHVGIGPNLLVEGRNEMKET